MASTRSVPVCTALCLLVFLFFTNIALASLSGSSDRAASSHHSFTCNQVRELFEGGIGSPTGLHSQPEHEAESSMCRRGRSGGEYTCCSVDTENSFTETVDRRLKEGVRQRNHALKKRLNNIVARYQERLRQLHSEAENRTAAFLSRLHKIPWAEHRPVVANLYRGLQALLVPKHGAQGGGGGGWVGELDEVVRDFFVNLFPAVFNYVLSRRDQGEERHPISPDYHSCLKRYADQIQPFGNQPEQLLRHLKRSIWHAQSFQEALKTLVQAMASTEGASMDASCRRALVRLQVCPGCRGVSVQTPSVKPCRGLCLNVMRGCLARMSEISYNWDDLVVAFENLQVGMLGQYDLHKTLMYLDMNVSDAIMMAMDDSPRIYDEVQVKCQDVPQTAADKPLPLPLIPEGDEGATTEAAAIAPRGTHVLREFRQEMRSLVKALEDSKGRFNRMPDTLCEDDKVYGQDMLSATCWNGTGVGRYMEQVPEANFLSQVQRNKEVKVNISPMDPDFRFLKVKESLTHMRRSLTVLLNAEIMQGDSPQVKPHAYKSADREGSGRMYHHDVIVDDEDLVAYGSGSASGSGDDEGDEGDTYDKTEAPITRRPTTPPSSGSLPSISVVVLSLALGLHSLLNTLHH